MSLQPRTAGYLFLLASMTALGPLGTDMYLASLPDMAKEFGVPASSAQVTLSIFLLGFAVGNIIVGPLADRFGRKPIMLGGLAIFTLGSFLCIIAPTMEALWAARLLQALGGGAPIVLARTTVRDVYAPKDAAVALSYLSSISGMAPILGPMLGGWLHVQFGWQATFWFLGLYGAAVVALAATSYKETLNPDYVQPIRPLTILKNYSVLMRTPAYVGYMACMSFGFAGVFAYLSGSSFVYQGVFGLGADTFGLVFGAIVLGFVSGTLINARLSPRLGPGFMLAAGIWLIAGSGLIMAVMALSGVNHLAAMVVPQVGYVLGMGIIMPQAFAGALMPFPHMAGTASSLLGFVQLSLAAVAGAIVGLFLDVEPVPGGQIPLALNIAFWGLLALIAHEVSRRPRAAAVQEAEAAETAPAAGK